MKYQIIYKLSITNRLHQIHWGVLWNPEFPAPALLSIPTQPCTKLYLTLSTKSTFKSYSFQSNSNKNCFLVTCSETTSCCFFFCVHILHSSVDIVCVCRFKMEVHVEPNMSCYYICGTERWQTVQNEGHIWLAWTYTIFDLTRCTAAHACVIMVLLPPITHWGYHSTSHLMSSTNLKTKIMS